jgi:hypothetical protein
VICILNFILLFNDFHNGELCKPNTCNALCVVYFLTMLAQIVRHQMVGWIMVMNCKIFGSGHGQIKVPLWHWPGVGAEENCKNL